MRFLLVAINSKFIHSCPAVYSLKAYADSKIHSDSIVDIAEYTINQQVEDIIAGIYNRKPDCIGFSCYIWNSDVMRKILPEIHKILPNVKIFLGGPEVTYHPDKVMTDYPYITGVMIGEGEETFAELVEKLTYNSADDMLSINGLYLSTGYTGVRKSLSMDEVPFYYENPLPECFENRILYYESSRGCPFSCSYCLSSIDKTLRYRDIDSVKEHLACFLNAKVKQVKFIDRTFNANHDHAMDIWKFIYENDNGITNFHFEIAADILKDDQIELLSKMRPGLIQLEIGVQSTNETTLKAINRYVSTSHIRKVTSKLLKSHNVHIHLDLIAGLPYEDYRSFVTSFNEVYNMNPHQLQLGFLKVLKGTSIEEHIEEYGIKYLDSAPYEVLSTNWITYDEILKLKDVEKVLEDYYNSAQFTQTIPRLLKMYDTPYELYEALAVFYRANDYFVKVPARSRKYEIILEFVSHETTNDVSKIEEIRESLTLDYYLRENPKSKPAFVKNVPDMSLFDYSQRDPITYNVKYNNA